MNKPIITIGQHSYRLSKTPEGENCCKLCDIQPLCLNRSNKAEDPECLMFASGEQNKIDWHFKKIVEH